MKIIQVAVFFTFSIVPLFANADLQNFVKKFEATGFVNDFANLLNDNQQTQLEHKISAINDSTSIQFAVCTIKSLEDNTIKEFAKALGNFWGVGHKELNNGILLVTTVAERKIYIALGEGSEKYIEEDYLKTLIKEVIKPAFVKGKFADGFNFGIEKIYMKLRGSGVDMRAVKAKQKTTWIIFGAGTLLVLILLAFLYLKRQK